MKVIITIEIEVPESKIDKWVTYDVDENEHPALIDGSATPEFVKHMDQRLYHLDMSSGNPFGGEIVEGKITRIYVPAKREVDSDLGDGYC